MTFTNFVLYIRLTKREEVGPMRIKKLAYHPELWPRITREGNVFSGWLIVPGARWRGVTPSD